MQLGQTPEPDVPWHEIVGVIGNMKQNLATDPAAELYFPLRQADTVLPVNFVSLVLRTANDPRAAVARAARRRARNSIPTSRWSRSGRWRRTSPHPSPQPRFRTTLLGIFAGCALLLSVVGLYGVMTYSVTRRAAEIGIRMALGAQRGDILRMVLAEGLRLALAGLAIGGAGSLALTRLLSNFLYATTATDPLTYVAVAAAADRRWRCSRATSRRAAPCGSTRSCAALRLRS